MTKWEKEADEMHNKGVDDGLAGRPKSHPYMRLPKHVCAIAYNEGYAIGQAQRQQGEKSMHTTP
jgi:hypothetical protein